MRDTRLDAEVIREAARGRADAVLRALAPQLGPALDRPGRHVPCPVHGGKDGFRVFRDVAETGGGICNSCGAAPDLFATLMWVNGWTFREALEAIAAHLGMAAESPAPRPAPTPAPSPASNDDVRRRRRALRRAWRESHPIRTATDAMPVAWYLRARGLQPILGAMPHDLRYHPALPYWDTTGDEPVHVGDYPAMLAIVRVPGGQPVTVHRTYLTHQGEKAPVEAPRKLMAAPVNGATTGGAIRLYAPGSTLAVAEGIETALSVRAATGWPVWSTVCAPLMARLELPDGLDELVVAADADQAGLDAAEELARRAARRGIQARVAVPPEPGQDWNDVIDGGAA